MKTLPAWLGTLVLVGAGAFAPSALAQASKDVRVINTPAEAVPVTVTAPVTVANPAASPVRVRDVDRVGANLYQSSVTVDLTFNSFGNSAFLAPIPPNTVLVIEHVSIFSSTPVGQRLHVNLTVGVVNGAGIRHWFTPETIFNAGGNGSAEVQILSQQVSIASNMQPLAHVGRTSIAGGDTSVEITLSGRLVPVVP